MAKRRRIELGQVEDVVPTLPADLRFDILPNLPADLRFEIFSRLPVKSLMHCKFVCKSWCSFIRSPYFVTAYRNKLKNLTHHTTNLLFTIPAKHSQFFSTQIHHDKSGNIHAKPLVRLRSAPYRVSPFRSCTLAASAGVVCHFGLKDHESLKRAKEPVHIYNIYTGEVVNLQLPRPLFGRVAIALGFSSLTNEYKVLTCRTGTTVFKFKIFTLGGTSNTWKDVADIDYEALGLDPYRLTFSQHYLCIHGAIHWMQRFLCKNRPVLLAFDVVEERFRVILLPQESKNETGYRVIEVNGCVAVFNLKVREKMKVMDFWILKDYQNEVWVREKIMFPVPWGRLGSPYPVCSIHTGEILLSQLFPFSDGVRKNGLLHLYDMKLKTYKKTDIVLPEGSVVVAGGYAETISRLD